jgi:hypothetical protein
MGRNLADAIDTGSGRSLCIIERCVGFFNHSQSSLTSMKRSAFGKNTKFALIVTKLAENYREKVKLKYGVFFNH